MADTVTTMDKVPTVEASTTDVKVMDVDESMEQVNISADTDSLIGEKFDDLPATSSSVSNDEPSTVEERTFPRFKELPAEIRLKIWQYNLPSHRIHVMPEPEDTSDGFGIDSQHPVLQPANLHACSESRTEFLKLIQRGVFRNFRCEANALFDDFSEPPIPYVSNLVVDFDTDIIYLTDDYHRLDLMPGILEAKKIAILVEGRLAKMKPGENGRWTIGHGQIYLWKLLGGKVEEVIFVQDETFILRAMADPKNPEHFPKGDVELKHCPGFWTGKKSQQYCEEVFTTKWVMSETDREKNGMFRWRESHYWCRWQPTIDAVIDPIYLSGPFKAIGQPPKISFAFAERKRPKTSPEEVARVSLDENSPSVPTESESESDSDSESEPSPDN